jgi:hypothetical protein
MRAVGVGRAGGNAKGVLPQQSTLLGYCVGEVVVLLHDLQDVAVVLQAEVDLACDQEVLARVGGELLDPRLGLDQHPCGLVDLRRVVGVE